jgi:hypothetical protein
MNPNPNPTRHLADLCGIVAPAIGGKQAASGAEEVPLSGKVQG